MPQGRVHIAAAVALAVAVSLVFAAAAGAGRAPKGKEGKALKHAVHASPVGGIGKVSTKRYRITGQRVSTVSGSWAKEELVARPGYESTFQNATVVAVRLAGTAKWVVVDVGTAQVGCGIAPAKVLADLFKVKHPCPS